MSKIDKREMLRRVGDGHYIEHPELFVPETTDWKFLPWQREAFDKLFTNGRLKTSCVRGAGGTTFALLAAYHFLALNPPSKALYITPHWRLFNHYAKAVMSTSILSDDFSVTKTSIFYKDLPDTWSILALSGNCQPERFEGFSGPDNGKNLFIVIDNAQDVSWAVIDTLERALLPNMNHYFYVNYSGQDAMGVE